MQTHVTVTKAEYRWHQEVSGTKAEWVDGGVRTLPSARDPHVVITDSLVETIRPRLRRLKGPCRFRGVDCQIGPRRGGWLTYPDGLIACPPEFDPEETVAVCVNPTVIFEVSSPSTARYDRTAKFERYKEIPEFREYVLVEPETPRIDLLRAPDWIVETIEGFDAVLRLETVGIEIPLSEIYVDLTPGG